MDQHGALEKTIKDLLEEVGLDFQIATSKSPLDFDLTVALLFKIKGDFGSLQENSVRDKVQEIKSKILDSPVVRRQLDLYEKAGLKDREELRKIELELKDLQRYKNHYDLEMKLRHGESNG